MQSKYAPIIVFVYNRVDCTQKVITSLAQNSIASDSCLYIFSDGAKSDSDKHEVEKVREYINRVSDLGIFKGVSLIESKKNQGLATSIISGVTEIIKQYGKVIVLEDDNVCTSDFLQFMNDSLDYYENNKKIWSVGGYSFIKDIPKNYYHSVYLMGRTCSYAWGTWLNRWENVDWKVKSYDSFMWNLLKRYRFNRYGNDRAVLLDMQMHGWVDSWAIRFCYAMFENRMYTILPISTKVRNIGMDARSTHNKVYLPQFDVALPKAEVPYVLEDVKLNRKLVKRFSEKFHLPIKNRQKMYIECVIKKKSRLDRYRVKKITYRNCNKKMIFLEDDLSVAKVREHFKHNKQTIYIKNVEEELVGIISIGDYKRHEGQIFINRNFFSFENSIGLDEVRNFFINHIRINAVPVIDAKRYVGEYVCKRG